MAPAVRLVSGIVLVALVACGAAACGRKGPLEPPPSAAVTATDGAAAPADETTAKKPDKPFLLDPLIK